MYSDVLEQLPCFTRRDDLRFTCAVLAWTCPSTLLEDAVSRAALNARVKMIKYTTRLNKKLKIIEI